MCCMLGLQVDAYANKLHVLTQGDLVAGVQARTDKSGTVRGGWGLQGQQG